MKKIYLAIMIVFAGLIFAGCALDEIPALEVTAVEDMSKISAPRRDSQAMVTFGGRNLVDIGVSNTEYFVLRSTGQVNIYRLNSPTTFVGMLNTNFNAIDYVNTGSRSWGLIGANNSSRKLMLWLEALLPVTGPIQAE